MLIRAAYVLLAGTMLMCAARAQAAHVVEMTLPRMADEAAHVVIGTVVSNDCAWADAPRRIETTLVLADVVVLKGPGNDVDASGHLVVRLPGGRVGAWQQRVCCAPQFKPGETWCLFLLPHSSIHPVVGLYQGALRFAVDERGVERVRSAHGAWLTAIDTTGGLQFAPDRALGVRSGVAGAERSQPVVREARNVVILPSAMPSRLRDLVEPDLTTAEFLEALQSVLLSSRVHAVGRIGNAWVPARVSPVPLKAVSPSVEGAGVLRATGAVQRATPAPRGGGRR